MGLSSPVAAPVYSSRFMCVRSPIVLCYPPPVVSLGVRCTAPVRRVPSGAPSQAGQRVDRAPGDAAMIADVAQMAHKKEEEEKKGYSKHAQFIPVAACCALLLSSSPSISED